MDIFEKHYSTYRFIMSIVGLWPFHESIYRTIQRVLFSVILFCVLVIQIETLLKSGSSIQKRVTLSSSMSPMFLFFVRYVSFVFKLPSVRFFYNFVRTEETLLQDSNEAQILVKCYESSNRVFYVLLCTGFIGFLSTLSLLFVPITLDLVVPLNESRTRNIQYFFIDSSNGRTLYVDTLCLLAVTAFAVGLLSMVCTESALIILAHYLCGLFRITCYRLRNAIRNATNSSALSNQVKVNYMDFRRVVDAHRRAIECINVVSTETTITYLIAIVLVVISFSLGLYRMYKAVSLMHDAKEVFFSCVIVFAHLMFMFINNYNGQMVIDNSMEVFNELYDSMWYFTPLEVQKMILFVMLKSSVQYSFNLSGLFVPCYTGFSRMMSGSFSYFTLMYSTQ